MLTKKHSNLFNIVASPIEANRFISFGKVIKADPAHMQYINNGRTKRYHDLAPITTYGTNPSVLFNIFRGRPFSFPMNIRMVERHPYSSQTFFPIDNISFLVVVAQDNNGIPQKPQAFFTHVGEGVHYHANVWHHPLLVLEKTSDFIVIDHKCEENNIEEYFYNKTYRICCRE
ncbi:MAG: ureidoglycolate lyase [Candidatus Tokpelaia sp. JSC161]|jgi:ureidoglycolate lyase|nr:MAG: ureidoglycolate lyase [Candidatus Tokpelaia sp. JSC161]